MLPLVILSALSLLLSSNVQSINGQAHEHTHRSNILIVVDAQRCFSTEGPLIVPGGNDVMSSINRLANLEYFDQVIFTQDWHPADHVSFASNHWGEYPYLPHPKLTKRGYQSNIVHRPAQPETEIVLAYTPAGHLCGYEEVYEKGRSCPGLDLAAIQSIPFDGSTSYTEPSNSVTYTLVKQMLWSDHCIQSTPIADLHPSLTMPDHATTLKKGTESHIDAYSAFADAAHISRTSITEQINRFRHAHLYVIGLALDYCVHHTALDARTLERYEVTVLEDATRPISRQRGEQVKDDMRRRGIRISHAQHIPGFNSPRHDDL